MVDHFHGDGESACEGVGVRKCIRDHCVCEALPEPAVVPRNFIVNASYVPPRRVLRETVVVERLLIASTPVTECAVVADVAACSAGCVKESGERFEQSTMQLPEHRAVINSILEHLSRAARIAKSLEESHAGEPFEIIVGLFLEDY